MILRPDRSDYEKNFCELMFQRGFQIFWSEGIECYVYGADYLYMGSLEVDDIPRSEQEVEFFLFKLCMERFSSEL